MMFDDVDPERLRLRLSEKWQRYGSPMLPAWVAEMDFPIAEPVRQVLTRAIELDDFGYPAGLDERRVPEAFAERMRQRYGWNAAAERVVVLSDVVQGLYLSLLGFTAPGDGVVIQTPIYPPFLFSVRDTQRRLENCPLVDDGKGWVIDFDRLRAAPANVRALLLCHPHNPTGRAFGRPELEALAALAIERRWVVLSDEIHADLTHAGREFIPFASLGEEVAERTVTFSSASKAFNIAGLRCAVAHFGTRELMHRFQTVVPAYVRGGVGILSQHATVAAWREGDVWLEQVRAYLELSRHHVVGRLRSLLPEVSVHLPEATYLAWLDLRALELRPSPAEFFREKAQVALSDGVYFGPGYDGHARLNFATSRVLLDQILERMASAVRAR
jgi:cysteine-S-conjugate beta-lyase